MVCYVALEMATAGTGEVDDEPDTPEVFLKMDQPILAIEDSLSNSKLELVAEGGSFPDLVQETKVLLERGALTCNNEESHVGIVGAISLVEKVDNLLTMANQEVAAELDMLAAQPLLTGGRLTGGKKSGAPPFHLIQESNHVMPSLPEPDTCMTNTVMDSHCSDGRDASRHLIPTDMEPVPSEQNEAGHDVGVCGEVWQPHAPVPAHIPAPHGTPLGLSLEEFPPLEKGRTLKIRDSYEAGMGRHAGGR